jgi:O-antigen/teichoic acid export membrane protein
MAKLTQAIQNKLQIDVKYFLKNGTWSSLVQFTQMVSGIVIAMVLTRVLTQELYGYYGFLFSIFSLLGLLSITEMARSVFRSSAKGEAGNLAEIFWFRFKWSLLGTAIMIGLGVWYFHQANDILGWGFLVLSLFFPFYFAPGMWKSFLEGEKNFKTSFYYYLVVSLFKTVATILAAYFYRDYVVAIIFFSLASFCLVNIYFYLKVLKKAKKHKVSKETIDYGFYLTKMSFLANVANYFDRMLLGFFMAPSIFAVYSIALVPSETFGGFLKALLNTTIPKFIDAGYERSIKKMFKTLKWILPLLVVGIFIAIVCTPYAILFVFTPKYEQSILWAQIMLLSTFFMFLEGLFYNLNMAYAKRKVILKITMIFPLIRMGCIAGGFMMNGVMGIIWAHMVYRAINTSLYIYFLKTDK